MSRKHIFVIAILVIIVMFITGYVLISRCDLNYLKPRIARTVSDSLGQKLKINGDIRLRPGFTPIFAADGLVLQNAKACPDSEWASIKRLEIEVGLLPLIQRRVEIKRLVLIEPDVLIETDSLGNWNIQSLDKKGANKEAIVEKVPTGRKTRIPFLEINELRIDKGHFTYRDGEKGKSYSVFLDNFTAQAVSRESPLKLDLKCQYKDTAFAVQGTLSSLVSLIDPKETCSVNLKTDTCGASLTVQAEIRDVFKAEGVSASIAAEGRAFSEILALANLPHLPDFGPFNLRFKAADPEGDLRIEKFELNAGSKELAKIKLSSDRVNPFSLQETEVIFEVQGTELTHLRDILGRKLPLRGPFNVSGRFTEVSKKSYRIRDLRVLLGKRDICGWIEFDFTHKRPKFTASVSSENLDLLPLFGTRGQQISDKRQNSKTSEARDRVFPDQPLCFDALNKADVDLEIRARRMLLPRLSFNDFKAHVVLENGRFTANPFSFGIDGGTVDGHVYLKAGKNMTDIALGLSATHFPIDQMLKDLGVGFIIEGRLDGDIEVASRGSSVAGLMAALDGKTSIVMGKSKVDNKHIGLLAADLSSSLFRLLNPYRQGVEQTVVNCFVSRFHIKKGLASSTAMVLDTESVSVVGQGKIDLKTEEIDISFKPFPKKGVGISGVGKVSLSLGELAKPLNLAGTLSHPSLVIDPKRTAVTVGKALGGILLFGPFGIAAVLAGSADGEENPCLCAIKTADRRTKASLEKEQKREKGKPEEPSTSIGQSIKAALGGAHRTVKNFFNKLTKGNGDTASKNDYDYR